MPRAAPYVTRGGRTTSPKKATETGSSPVTRSRAPAAPRSQVKKLIPTPEKKRPKATTQPRALAKGSIPRKSPEPEEDGEWDPSGLIYLPSKEAPTQEGRPSAQSNLPVESEHAESQSGPRTVPRNQQKADAGQHEEIDNPAIVRPAHYVQAIERRLSHGDVPSLSSRRGVATAPSLNRGQAARPGQYGEEGTRAGKQWLQSHKATKRPVAEDDDEEMETQPDPIRRPSTRRDVRRSESFAPPPPTRQRYQDLPPTRTLSGRAGRPPVGSQGRVRTPLPRDTLFGGVVEVTLSPPTPLPPRARPTTYTARRTGKAGLPVLERPARPPSRQLAARPAPKPRPRQYDPPASRRKAPERSLEVMKEYDGHQPGRPARHRDSPGDSEAGSSQSSRASGVDDVELEPLASVMHLADPVDPPTSAGEGARKRAEGHRHQAPHPSQPSKQHGRRRPQEDQGTGMSNPKRRRIDENSTARSDRVSFHLPSPASPAKKSAPKPLSAIFDARQFGLGRELEKRKAEWEDEDEKLVRRFHPVKGAKGGRKTIMVESKGSPGELKMSRNYSVVGRVHRYQELARNQRQAHPMTPTKNIIPSPKSTRKRPTDLNTARSLPLAAFKPRERKTHASDTATKGFQAIDQNLVAAGNRDLLDQILASGVKKSKGAAGTGKKRPQTPPHHLHLRTGLAATIERPVVEYPEPIREFTPGPPATQPKHEITPVRQTPRARPGQLSFVNTDPVPRGERVPSQTPTTRLRQEQKKYEDQWERDKGDYLEEVDEPALPLEPARQVPAPAPIKTPPIVKPPQTAPPIKQTIQPANTATRAKPVPTTPTRPGLHPPVTHLPLPTGRPPLADITASSSPPSGPSTDIATVTMTAEISNTQLMRDVDEMLQAVPMSDIDAEKLASELDEMLEAADEDVHCDEHFGGIQPGAKKVARPVQPQADAQGGMSGLEMTEHILKTLHLLHDDDAPGEAGAGGGTGGEGQTQGQRITTLSSGQTGGKTTSASASKKSNTRQRKGKNAISRPKQDSNDPTQGKLNFRPVGPIELDSQIPQGTGAPYAEPRIAPSLRPTTVPFGTSAPDPTMSESTPQVIWSATPGVITQPMPGATQGEERVTTPVEYEMANPRKRTVLKAPRGGLVQTKSGGRGSAPGERIQRKTTETNVGLKNTSSRPEIGAPRSGARPRWATENADTQATGSEAGIGHCSPTQIGTTPGKSSGHQESFKSFPIASTITRTQSVIPSGVQTGRKKRTMVLAASKGSDEAANEEQDELDGDSTEAEEEIESPRPRPAAGDKSLTTLGYAVKQPISHKTTAQAQLGHQRAETKGTAAPARAAQATARASVSTKTKTLGLRAGRSPSKVRADVFTTESFLSASTMATPAARAPFKPPSRTPSLAMSLGLEPSLGGQRALNTWEMSDTEEDEEVDDY